MKKIILLSLLFCSNQGFAFDLTLGGEYRFNATYLSEVPRRTFFNHNLILKPEILANDSIKFHSMLEFFRCKKDFYCNENYIGGSPLGEIDQSVHVNLGYVSWTREYGRLLMGRIPIEFGMGLDLSSRNRNYLDYLDGVQYKAIIGNMKLLPTVGVITRNGNIESTSYMISGFFENSDITLGGLYLRKTANIRGQLLNDTKGLYAKKQISKVKIESELNMKSGQHVKFKGLSLDGSDNEEQTNQKLNSLGLVLKVQSDQILFNERLGFGLHSGYLSGDKQSTGDTYEGFLSDRDYDTGLILFNHVLGSGLLGTDNLYLNIPDRSKAPDVEFLSNAFFLSPEANFSLTEKIDFKLNVLWAVTAVPQNVSNQNLGVEVDLIASYKFNEVAKASLEIGHLFKGRAFAQRKGVTLIQTGLDFLF